MKKIALIIILAFFLPLSTHAATALIHVPEKYSVVKAGQRFYYQLDIVYPENNRRRDLDILYTVSKGGNVIARAKFLKAIETQSSFIDFFVIPEDAPSGLYTIEVEVTTVDSGAKWGGISATFRITNDPNWPLIYFIVLLCAILLTGYFLRREIHEHHHHD